MSTSDKMKDEFIEDSDKLSPPNQSLPKKSNGSQGSMISMDIQVGIKATWVFRIIRSTSKSFRKTFNFLSKPESQQGSSKSSQIQKTLFGTNALNPSRRCYFVWLFIISSAVFYNLVLGPGFGVR